MYISLLMFVSLHIFTYVYGLVLLMYLFFCFETPPRHGWNTLHWRMAVVPWLRPSCDAKFNPIWEVGRFILPRQPLLMLKWLKGHWNELRLVPVFWGVWASSMAWPMQRFCGMFKCKLNPRRVWKHWNQNSIWSPEWNWRKTSFTSCSDRGVPWCPILINKCSITWILVKFCDWVLFPFFPRSYLQQCCPLISGFAHHCSDSP